MTILAESYSLDQHIKNDQSFLTAYLRALCSIASSEGFTSLAEYSIINDIVDQVDETALASVVLLDALDNPRPLPTSLQQLKTASKGKEVTNELRKLTFDRASPLLLLHGYKSQDLAKKLASALDYKVSQDELDKIFLREQNKPWLEIIKRISTRLIKGNRFSNLAELSFKVTRDVSVSKFVFQYEDGLVTLNQLNDYLLDKFAKINNQIQSYENELNVTEFGAMATNLHLKTAQTLKDQIEKKLAVLEARLDFERTSFNEKIDYDVDDAGNVFEVHINERLATDQWKNPAVWESIKNSMAKELESRLRRICEHQEKSLQLLKDDLRLFQDEMSFTRVSILNKQHHKKHVPSLRGMRFITRAANAANKAANVTLTLTGLAAAGTGASAYFLGTAVLLPAIGPVLPIIAMPVAVAALIKFFSNAERGKRLEVLHTRKEFENIFREQLKSAQVSFNNQLDALEKDFRQTAQNIIQPIMLEAEAADSVAGLQIKMIKRLIEESKNKLSQITKLIQTG